MIAAGITSGHLFAADVAFLVAFLAACLVVVSAVVPRLLAVSSAFLAVAVAAVALGLLLL